MRLSAHWKKTICSSIKLMPVCALAAIGSGAARSSQAQLTGAKVSTTQEQLLTALGTTQVKVVFTCQDIPYFVDFSEAVPQIRKLSGVTTAYFPVISSDGKWVTYQTGNSDEGPSQKPPATVWLRELAANGTPIKVADTGYVPRFVQNTPADTPEIIYATSLACPQANCNNYGMTVKKKIVNKVPQAAQVVFGQGSYYGGMSWDNRYLITGWPAGLNCFMLDLQNSSVAPAAIHSMHVKKPRNIGGVIDTVDTNVALGTCNISRSASRVFTGTAMYFDFGSGLMTAAKCFHPLLKTWGEHEKLFISRYDSEDVRVFDMPADRQLTPTSSATGKGEAIGKTWENPEWSTHPYYGTSSLLVRRLWPKVGGIFQDTKNLELIYLVNLKSSTFIRLVESSDTAQTSKISFSNPFLWVEVPAGFQEDQTWLSKTIWESVGVINPYKSRPRFDPKGTLFSIANITEITIYSALGRKIASIKPAGKTAIADAENTLRSMRPGVYFIGIESQGKQRQMIPWVTLSH
jgi:hypothetical protein